MSRFLRTACAAALAVAAFGAATSTAQAQTYNRLVVFGDSLSDNGNLTVPFGGVGAPPPPYFQGRFSNGPVFTELLGFTAVRGATPGASVSGSINYAYGGARTDNTVLNFGISPPTVPGMRTQLTTYTNAGGTFGANDLVSVLGGANNIFQAFPGAAASPATAQSTMQTVALSAANDINFIVNTIAQAGAGTILVSNLPRLGITPQFAPTNPSVGPAGSALADFSGTTFNSALLSNLRTTAAARPGSNIILMDLYKISDPLRANPGAFGLTNVTSSCFTGVSVCANPDGYLYWDGVHPTAAGHRLLARLANDYLYYGDIGAQSTVQSETGFRQRQDLLDMTGEMVSRYAPWVPGTHMTFAVIADSVETDARGSVASADATGWGGRVGLDYVASPTARYGFTATLRETEVEAGAMQFDVRSYAVDAYAGWRMGDMFVNATAGGSIDQYDDISRVTSLAPIVHMGETDGGSLGAKVQAGLWFDMGGIAISPRVALSYVSTDVNGYNEAGFAAEYAYQDRTVAAASGEVSLRAEGGGDNLNFYVEGGYRDTFGDSSDDVRVGIVGNPAQILSRSFDDPFGGSLMASAGVEADVGPFRMSAGYRGRFGDSADSHVGAITLKLPLQ